MGVERDWQGRATENNYNGKEDETYIYFIIVFLL